MTLLGHTMNACRLRGLVEGTDLAVIDLDKCLFPGYSQTVLGALVLWRLLRRPLRRSDRKCVGALLRGGVYITWSKVRHPSNRRLLSVYGEVMRGVPERYFLEEVQRLPRYCRRGAREVLEVLSRQALVGIVSLGVDVIARGFVKRLPGLSFYRSNTLWFDGADPRRPLLGYREPVMYDGSAKARALRQMLAVSGTDCPLVVGHDADDVPTAAVAREVGGWSIGIRPRRHWRKYFDVWTTCADWAPLLKLWG